MYYTCRQIADITQSKIMGNADSIVKVIFFDSRTIYSASQAAFIAINTSKNSGEKYIINAIDKGIKIIISEKHLDQFPEVTWIIVKDSVQFLQDLAKHHLSTLPQLLTIGITGSNGKTNVKEWLFQSLSQDFSVVKSPKSFNSQLGLPLSILQATENQNIGIFEVGVSKPGEMQKQAQYFSPKIGILTHIGSAHSANFVSQEALFLEKIKLFQHSETIIYNGDYTDIKEKLGQKFPEKNLISYGNGIENDIHVSKMDSITSEIEIKIFDRKIKLNSKKQDAATLNNALCVIAVLNEFEFPDEKIIEKIEQLKAVEMRLESVEGLRNNLIINDSYNLDLDSLKIAFQFTNSYNKSKKYLILTDFIEGKDADKVYQEVVELTNAQNFEQLFLIGNQIKKYAPYFTAKTHTYQSSQELIDNQEINAIENALILIKGARIFETEKIKNFLELQKHDTVLEINLQAILHNISIHQTYLRPETKIMAMVKAFSYGLGGYEIAEFLQHHHIDYLAVAYADEGIDLRKNGITTPILVMNPEQHSYNSIIEYNLEPEIYSFRVLDLFLNALQSKGFSEVYPIHLKIETGMHRLGFKSEEIAALIQKLKKAPVKVASIFSHLSSSDLPNEKEFTQLQAEQFSLIANQIIDGIGYKPLLHLLNSSGITNYPEYQFDMVRIGIGMVGISADYSVEKKLQSAVCFKTVISQISSINSGESVGYSRKFVAAENTRIATIPVGYADGVPRLIGNGLGKLGVNQQLAPIVGNICMDMMMLDLKDISAKEGDEVIIFNGNPSLQQFAEYCNTIPYEVLTSISRRVKRIYIKN